MQPLTIRTRAPFKQPIVYKSTDDDDKNVENTAARKLGGVSACGLTIKRRGFVLQRAPTRSCQAPRTPLPPTTPPINHPMVRHIVIVSLNVHQMHNFSKYKDPAYLLPHQPITHYHCLVTMMRYDATYRYSCMIFHYSYLVFLRVSVRCHSFNVFQISSVAVKSR